MLNNENWLGQSFINTPYEFFVIMDGLFEERFSIGQVGIDRQELQMWRRHKIVSVAESSTDKREWVKVSFFELFWLKILDEMRSLKIPFEIIKKVDSYFHSIEDELVEALAEKFTSNFLIENTKDSNFKAELQSQLPLIKKDPQFVVYLKERINRLILIALELLGQNSPVYLIIDPVKKEPELLILNPDFLEEFDLKETFLRSSSYYCIYLNKIMNSFFNNDKVKEDDLHRLFKLSKAERKIITLLRKEGIKELRVKFSQAQKKGTLMIEVVETSDLKEIEKKVHGILEKEKFKQITIATEGNQIVFVEQTTKLKVNINEN